MSITVNAAKWSKDKEGTWVSFLVSPTSVGEAMTLAEGLQEPQEIRIKPASRSLDQNALLWAIIDRIAELIRESPKTVYRRAIRDIAGVSDIVCVQNKGVKSLTDIWESKGIGWQTEVFPSKIEGCSNIILYYGSSSFDKKQMNALIDRVIEDANELGINTDSPAIQALLKTKK